MPAPDKYERPIGEIRDILLARAKHNRNPLDNVDTDIACRVVEGLTSTDRDAWAAAFGAAAEPYVERARTAEAKGDKAAAAKAWRLAYGFYRVARYPCMNSPGKQHAYKLSQECFVAEGKLADPPLRVVRIPFKGRADEGAEIVAYLRVPNTRPANGHPVIIIWGGIDSFKEERRVDRYVKAGLAGLAIDMPGVADAPIAGSDDAERMWDPIFDWIAGPEGKAAGLDPARVAVVGCSTGGYWATKLAHTHRDRLAAAVNHGGPAHFAFARDWIYRATRGEYPFELAETLACAFGRSTFEDWLDYAPKLSLLDMGLLDKPCAPLLCINGIDDSVFPIEDHYLLLKHGDPKAARFFAGGHMGHEGGDVVKTLIDWLVERLKPEARA